jgi:sporulation protein YlmC with PRC-barrel domain
MTLFLFSQMVGKPILDTHREKVAVLKDVVVRINPDEGKSEETYPPLAGVLAHGAGRDAIFGFRLSN